MNGSRQINPSPAQDGADARKRTPIRTFSPDYEQNPGNRWVVNRINKIVSSPEKRAEELDSIRNALFVYACIKIDCGPDTMGQLTSILDPENSNPELRKVWELRAAAALMLGGTRSKEAIPALISAFEKEDNLHVKEEICLALGVIGLEGAPLMRFSEAVILGLETAKWEGAEKKSEYMEFIQRSFYNSSFQPKVVIGEEQVEFLTQSLAGKRPGSEGPLNWPARASAALLLGASSSISTLPNLISVAAKKDEVPQVKDAAKAAAVRMGRKDMSPTEVREILNQFIAPGKGERPNPGLETAAIEILRLMNEDEADLTPMPHMPSSAELELQGPAQKFIGMLRAARESGDYYALASEFPVETVIRNMASHEHVRISAETIPELKSMFMDFMRAAIRVKGPEVYRRAINALVDVAIAGLLDARAELAGMGVGSPESPADPIKTELTLGPRERKFIESLRAAYNKGDYSGFVRDIKVGDAARMLICSSSLTIQDSQFPFLKQLTSDIILASVRARGQKAFMEAADALYDMALDEDPSVNILSMLVANMISPSKKTLRK